MKSIVVVAFNTQSFFLAQSLSRPRLSFDAVNINYLSRMYFHLLFRLSRARDLIFFCLFMSCIYLIIIMCVIIERKYFILVSSMSNALFKKSEREKKLNDHLRMLHHISTYNFNLASYFYYFRREIQHFLTNFCCWHSLCTELTNYAKLKIKRNASQARKKRWAINEL
jgi:hypothetical protein